MFDLTAIRLQQLAYLDAVAHHGSFGEAADDLLVSQPALSQGLARLEEIVGEPLFVPEGRNRRLTDAGREVAGFARSTLGQGELLQRRLAARRSGLAGDLRVGMIDAAALYLLTDELREFRSGHPAVGLRITVDASSRLSAAVATFELDLAIVVGPVDGFTSIELLREGLHVYGASEREPDDASGWVLYPPASRTRAVIDRGLARLGITPAVDTTSDNPAVIAQLVRLAGLHTVLPSGIAEAGEAPLTRLSEPIADRGVHLIRRTEKTEEPLVERFTEIVGSAR